MPIQKPQIHWSHISMLTRCGIQYENRYIKNQVRAPGVALLVGSAMHKGIEVNMLHKVESGEMLPVEAVAEATRDELNRRWNEDGVLLSDEEQSSGADNVRGAAVDMAVSLAQLHRTELAPTIRPAHVERKWVVGLNGFPFDLSGMIDLQETPEAHSVIHDTKTAARAPSQSSADDSDQLTMYAMAAFVLDGAIPPLQIDSLVKTKVPKAVVRVTTRVKSDIQVLVRRVEAAARAIESGVFLPAPQDSWQCSEKFCGYAKDCPFFRKRVTVAAGKDGDE